MSGQDNIYDEDNRKLIDSLDQALQACLNGEDVSDPLVKIFKGQIEELGVLQCPEPNARNEQIIKEWSAQNRGDLHKILICVRAKWLRQIQG